MKRTVFALVLVSVLLATPCGAEQLLPACDSLVALFRYTPEVPSLPVRLKSPARPVTSYWPVVVRAGKSHGVDPYLVHSVITFESAYNPRAVSSAGARGLMQLMPETGRLMGVLNPFDPEQNIHGGTRYLREMIDRFDGDLYRALLAYNAGPGRVDRGRIPSESHRYARMVLKRYGELQGR